MLGWRRYSSDYAQLSEGAGLSAGTSTSDEESTTASSRAGSGCINGRVARELSELKKECWLALRALGASPAAGTGTFFCRNGCFRPGGAFRGEQPSRAGDLVSSSSLLNHWWSLIASIDSV